MAWSEGLSSTACSWGRSGGRALHSLLTEAPWLDTKPPPLTRHIVRPGGTIRTSGARCQCQTVVIFTKWMSFFYLCTQTFEEESLSSDPCHCIKAGVTAVYEGAEGDTFSQYFTIIRTLCWAHLFLFEVHLLWLGRELAMHCEAAVLQSHFFDRQEARAKTSEFFCGLNIDDRAEFRLFIVCR